MLTKPNLIIIGAQKSGTTSLYHYLNAHPSIFMSRPIKEPGLFMNKAFIEKLFGKQLKLPVPSRRQLIEQYMLKGYSGQAYFGEASTYYTIGNISIRDKVAYRMYRTNRSMKLLYIVRNPFARIVSNYLHIRKRGYSEDSFRAFFATSHYQQALLTSQYWLQLQAYLAYFPAHQIKVVLFEDMLQEPTEVLADIYEFLQLEPASAKRLQAYNQSDNRETFEQRELMFPATEYGNAFRSISDDVCSLEQFMQRRLAVWDLSAARWREG